MRKYGRSCLFGQLRFYMLRNKKENGMKRLYRWIVVLLAAAMSVSLLPAVSVFAAETDAAETAVVEETVLNNEEQAAPAEEVPAPAEVPEVETPVPAEVPAVIPASPPPELSAFSAVVPAVSVGSNPFFSFRFKCFIFVLPCTCFFVL